MNPDLEAVLRSMGDLDPAQPDAREVLEALGPLPEDYVDFLLTFDGMDRTNGDAPLTRLRSGIGAVR